MTAPLDNKQILERAIQKAIDGGWRSPWLGKLVGTSSDIITGEMFVTFKYKELPVFGWSLFGLIYSTDFAKALWPGEKYDHEVDVVRPFVGLKLTGHPDTTPEKGKERASYVYQPWQYHLQQMVIAEDPIEYLGAHLDD